MPARTRTFIAIALPPDRAAKLERLQAQLGPSQPQARWVRPDQLHTTLAFLGDVDDSDLAQVCRTVADAARPFPSFTLELRGLGAFPNARRPSTLWVGLTGSGVETLTQLQAAIAEALRTTPYPPADDRFTPHVTLARFRDRRGRGKGGTPVDLTDLFRQHQGFSAGPFTVTEVVTFGSQITAEGPVYLALSRAPLERGKVAT